MNMTKRVWSGIKAAFFLAAVCGITAIGLAQDPGPVVQNPAYINIDRAFDFSEVQPAVNVHLPRFLLNNMMSQFDGGPNDPFAEMGINAKDLLNDIQLIRVVVFEAKDPQKMEIIRAGIQKLKQSMNPRWMPIVNVPDGNVTIYAMGDETGERMAGLAMLVADKDAAVIGNIVGEIQLGKIIALASQMANKSGGNAKAKEALEKLFGSMQPQPANPGSQAESPSGQEGSEANSPDRKNVQ